MANDEDDPDDLQLLNYVRMLRIIVDGSQVYWMIHE